MFLSPYAEFCVPVRFLILYSYIHESMTSLAVLNEHAIEIQLGQQSQHI